MIVYIALMAYILAFSNVALYLYFGNKFLRVLFNVFAGLGFLINIVELTLRFISTGQVPTSTLYDFFILMSAAFTMTYFFIYIKYRRPMIGMFLMPFNVFFSAAAIFVPAGEIYVIANSVWRFGHLPFIILGSTFFTAAFLAAMMYLIQERQLKNKRFGAVFKRFPPLDTINKINDTMLRAGFYFFTIGAALGFIWMFEQDLMMESIAKVVFSLVTWAIFALILFLRKWKGASPRHTALLTIIGFFSILITYLGVAAFLVR